MKRAHRIVAVAVLALVPSCTYHAADRPAGLSRGTIEQTTEYMKWAFKSQSAAHVYACLSQDLKDREDLNIGKLDLFFSEIESRVKRLVGDVETIEIVDVDQIDPRTAWVTYRSGRRKAQVRFRLETSYEIVPSFEEDDGDYALLPSLESALTIGDDGVILELPTEDLEVGADGIYEISVINAWLIDALDGRTLEEASP